MENPFEKIPERVPTKEDVLNFISRFAENFAVEDERSDNQGIYSLKARVENKESGEIAEYYYTRKGDFGKNQSSETIIHVVYYKNGEMISGENLATYNPGTNEWELD
jgi:hypothetical protein